MREEGNLIVRALKTSAWVTLLTTLALLGAGKNDWAWGFLTGAVLSLFSLFSLTVVVPMLLRPGASRAAQALLGLTLFMKLPIYMIGLYLIANVPAIKAAGAGFGIALLPVVITLKAIGSALAEAFPAQPKQAPSEAEVSPQQTARPARRLSAKPVHERG
ncbi:MAG TPA: hypothetical protein VFB38_07075 [Chthonomonadaceae bacterium]|nr:hypothetical protein [Chthonomonadaceae bacterium]